MGLCQVLIQIRGQNWYRNWASDKAYKNKVGFGVKGRKPLQPSEVVQA